MNLFIRLIITTVLALFKSKIRLDGRTCLVGRTWPWDYDIQGHMTNTRFLALADLAVFEFMIRSGGLNYFVSHRLLPVVLAREVKYRRMLTFPRQYKLHSRMAYWRDEYFCWHQVFEEDGKYAAEVYTLGVVLQRGTRDKVSPQDIAENLLGETVTSPEPNETVLNLIRRAQQRPELEDVMAAFEEHRLQG